VGRLQCHKEMKKKKNNTYKDVHRKKEKLTRAGEDHKLVDKKPEDKTW